MAVKPLTLSGCIRDLMWLARVVYKHGYVVASGGNLSVRIGEYILIKKSGCSFSSLVPKDFILTNLNNETVEKASIDYKIHRSIYLNTKSKYVLHAHPETVISISFESPESFNPIDFESKYYLGDSIPIVSGDHSSIYEEIGRLSSSNTIIIERGHGVYIHGADAIELFRVLQRLEHAAVIASSHRL